MFGQLNRLMHGGMVGDAIEPENLVKPKPQQILQSRFLRPALRPPRHQPIQRRLPADHAINQLLAQMPVGGRKPARGEGGLEQIFRKLTGLAPR